MILKMWLSVIDGSTSTYTSSGKLYYKDVETGFIPEPGVDDIVLYKHKDEDDEYDGPLWHVRRRYMDNKGNWHIDLSRLVINPNEHWQEIFKNRLAMGRNYNYETAWYTDRDEDPIPLLIRGGWVEY